MNSRSLGHPWSFWVSRVGLGYILLKAIVGGAESEVVCIYLHIHLSELMHDNYIGQGLNSHPTTSNLSYLPASPEHWQNCFFFFVSARQYFRCQHHRETGTCKRVTPGCSLLFLPTFTQLILPLSF